MEEIIKGEIVERGFEFLLIFFVLSLGIVVAIIADLADGIYTAKKTGQRIHSHKLRVTTDKFCEYWRFLLMAFIIDVVGLIVEARFQCYPLPFCSMAIGVGLVAVEIKSMFEHARRRKSHVTEIPELLRQIMAASSQKDARAAMRAIADYINYNEKEERK